SCPGSAGSASARAALAALPRCLPASRACPAVRSRRSQGEQIQTRAAVRMTGPPSPLADRSLQTARHLHLALIFCATYVLLNARLMPSGLAAPLPAHLLQSANPFQDRDF